MTARLALLTFLAAPATGSAWSACGHHAVSLIAYDLLSESEQDALVEMIEAHPRYDEDFRPRRGTNNELRFRVGRTGEWPDVARNTSFDRPKWHYQPVATLRIGDTRRPRTPGRLPRRSTLRTLDLHIAQAYELCRRVMADEDRSDSDRSLALTWIAHLVGDSHQPCHAGSLYAENVFNGPAGDRGANEIELTNGRNLHSLWDGLLGRGFNEIRVRREVFEITRDDDAVREAARRASMNDGLSPMRWLRESRELAEEVVYTNEVLGPIRAASRGRADRLPELTLSNDYLRTAGKAARIRVLQAGHRLAEVWSKCLE